MRTIWAIARNTLLMTLRRRAALALVLCIALAGPLLGFYAEGDGSLQGILKLVFTYSFSIMSALLMALLLYLSATVLDTELVNKQIFLLDVKPVPRWQVLLGKWLGLAILSALLVTIIGCQTYAVVLTVTATRIKPAWEILAGWGSVLVALTVYLVFSSRYGVVGRWLLRVVVVVWLGVTALLLAHSFRTMRERGTLGPWPDQVAEAHQQILVSRRSFRPILPDVDKEVTRYRKQLEMEGLLGKKSAWTPDELRAHLRKVVNRRLLPIQFGSFRSFRFQNLPTGASLDVGFTVRYRFHGTRAGGDAGWMQHGWELVNPETGQRLQPQIRRSKSGATREFHADAIVVSSKGELELRVHNLSERIGEGEEEKPPARINVPLDNGLEILVPTGSFEWNFVRALVLFWVRLAMIAAIGIAANTFLSGSVAMFLVFGIVFSGIMNTFVSNIVSPPRTRFSAETKDDRTLQKMRKDYGAVVGTGLGYTVIVKDRATAGLLEVLPNFDDTDPVPDLIVGREISALRLLWRMFVDIFLRAGMVAALGVWAYYRKEVGLPVIA